MGNRHSDETAGKTIEHTWIEVGKVPVKRSENADGHQPLFFAQQVATGEANGRPFEVVLSLTGGDLVVRFDEHEGRPAATYIVSVRDVASVAGDDATKKEG